MPTDTPAMADNPVASNANDVTRFADEVPFGPPATVAHDKTMVRKSPGGEVVTTLPSGVEVVKLSARGDQDLVCFDDPKAGGGHLMGWVAGSDLQDLAPPPGPDPDADAGPPAPPDPPPHKGHHHRGRHPRRQ